MQSAIPPVSPVMAAAYGRVRPDERRTAAAPSAQTAKTRAPAFSSARTEAGETQFSDNARSRDDKTKETVRLQTAYAPPGPSILQKGTLFDAVI